MRQMPSAGKVSSGELSRLRSAVERTVNKLCPPSLRGQREDIVQQVMLKLMRIQDQRSEGESPLPASYLWRAAYTTSVDELRKMRSREQTREQATVAGMGGPGGTLGPQRGVEAGEVGAAIRDCLAGLIESRRRAVSLYLVGHSVPEAGELLGWTRKKTENLVFRGLADLRACLLGKGVQP